jgi:hypothetical protein
MSALGDRLRRRAVDPGSFLGWAQGAGYLDPLDRCSDRDLDGIVAEYRNSVGRLGGGRAGQDPAAAAVRKAFVEVLAGRAARRRAVLDAFPPPAHLAPIIGGRP